MRKLVWLVVAAALSALQAVAAAQDHRPEGDVHPHHHDDGHFDRDHDDGGHVRHDNDRWRYKQHNGQWWYWTPANSWIIYSGGNWIPQAQYNAQLNRNYRGSYRTGYRGYDDGYRGVGRNQRREIKKWKGRKK